MHEIFYQCVNMIYKAHWTSRFTRCFNCILYQFTKMLWTKSATKCFTIVSGFTVVIGATYCSIFPSGKNSSSRHPLNHRLRNTVTAFVHRHHLFIILPSAHSSLSQQCNPPLRLSHYRYPAPVNFLSSVTVNTFACCLYPRCWSSNFR